MGRGGDLLWGVDCAVLALQVFYLNLTWIHSKIQYVTIESTAHIYIWEESGQGLVHWSDSRPDPVQSVSIAEKGCRSNPPNEPSIAKSSFTQIESIRVRYFSHESIRLVNDSALVSKTLGEDGIFHGMFVSHDCLEHWSFFSLRTGSHPV